MAAAQSELSMDEILASIRRIIHEEEEPPRQQSRLASDTNTVKLQTPEPAAQKAKPSQPAAKSESQQPKAQEPAKAEPAPKTETKPEEPKRAEAEEPVATMEPDAVATSEEKVLNDTFDEAPEIKTAEVVNTKSDKPAKPAPAETPAPATDARAEKEPGTKKPEPEQEADAKPAATAGDEADRMTDRIVKTLMDNAQAGAVSAQFASLKKQVGIASTPAVTLEGMVEELLRPMLKAWLDQNLPGIVEKKIDEEIRRLAEG
jgi:cell pole-organizing protein PopZ